jgi:hypothetical protein
MCSIWINLIFLIYLSFHIVALYNFLGCFLCNIICSVVSGVLQARDDCGQHPYPGWAAWQVLVVGGIMVSGGRPQPSGSFRGRWSSTLVVFDMRYGGCPFLSGHFFIQKRFILKIIF